MDLGLRGKVVLVTGGAGGIGRECATLFAAEGCSVVVSDVAEAGAAKIADQARALGVKALPIAADVADPRSVEALFSRAIAELGQVDVLVNNAGIFQSRPVVDLSLDDWEKVLRVNLTSVFLCSQAALRHMIPRRTGAIVSVASVAGQVGGLIAAANYATSKGAVASLTKSLAKAGGPHGVRVNCVNPGQIDTPMTAPWPNDVRQGMIRNTPLGRFGRADEVARVIVFLASDAASYIHGAHVDINGGSLMD